MKKHSQQKQNEKQPRGINRTEQLQVSGGAKVIRDGKLTDAEYLDFGVDMIDPSLK